MIIGNGQTNQVNEKQTNFFKLCFITLQTNQLDKKQTDYKKAATMLCMINGNRQTN